LSENILLLASIWDIKLSLEQIPGKDNAVADLLLRWRFCVNQVAMLFAVLNDIPSWYQVKSNDLLLDWLI
jgi:hypothetical protein